MLWATTDRISASSPLNSICVMDEAELAGLVNLEELWLGKNKIERISSLLALTKLHRLDVQSDRLTRVEGLEAQVHLLEVLYLSHNGIDDEGASYEGGLSLMFENLNTINMSRNRLTSTRPFGHLTSLVDLWISGNDIKTFDDVEDLRGLTNLDSSIWSTILSIRNSNIGRGWQR
jgi:protein phosphatase 1 regulatory subunit 7